MAPPQPNAVLRDSVFLITAGSDQKVIVWEIETGVELVAYSHPGPVRSVSWNEAGTQFASCTDNFADTPPCVSIYVRLVPQSSTNLFLSLRFSALTFNGSWA